MKIEIIVPPMGESITEVTIGQIIAKTGSTIRADAEILEIETDKVNQMLYAPQAGKIYLNVKFGETVKIGQTIGFIETFTEQKELKENKLENSSAYFSANENAIEEKISDNVSQEVPLRHTKDIFLNDLEVNIELKTQDLLQKDQRTTDRETRRPLSKIRKTIARHLVEAQQTMAILTTFNEVNMTPIIELREKYQESFTKKYGSKLGLMSFFVQATVAALKSFPTLNAYLDGDEIVQREYYNIGVAVGTDKGVIVPVLRNCDCLSFAEIEQSINQFAKKAKEDKLVANDLQGGGFTITNGGIYGSLLSTPILLPPQCGILGIHKIEKRPVVVQDQIVICSMMYLALSYDHRLIDGKEAVSFLGYIKDRLEDPFRLWLDI